MSVFPLEIPEKINSPELLAFFQQFGLDRYLSAEEINKITAALAELKELSVNVSIVNTIFLNNGFEKVDQLFTGFAGSEWNINGFNYTNPTDQEINIPLCASGKVRMDRVVLDTNNNFVLVQGVEVDENPVAEATPPNTLDYTLIPVNDSEIGEPEAPNLGDYYIPKAFDRAQIYTGTLPGTNVVIPLNYKGRRVIILQGNIVNIKGLSMSLIESQMPGAEIPHEGKIYTFINETPNPIAFNHFETSEDIFFISKSETDIVVPSKERIDFMLRSSTMEEHYKSWSSVSSEKSLYVSYTTAYLYTTGQWAAPLRGNDNVLTGTIQTRSYFGTGSTPALPNLICLYALKGVKQIKRITFSYYLNSYTVTPELYIQSSDANGTNIQIICQQTLAANTTSGLFSTILTVNSHTDLSDISALRWALRSSTYCDIFDVSFKIDYE